jgi:hypothetical protein
MNSLLSCCCYFKSVECLSFCWKFCGPLLSVLLVDLQLEVWKLFSLALFWWEGSFPKKVIKNMERYKYHTLTSLTEVLFYCLGVSKVFLLLNADHYCAWIGWYFTFFVCSTFKAFLKVNGTSLMQLVDRASFHFAAEYSLECLVLLFGCLFVGVLVWGDSLLLTMTIITIWIDWGCSFDLVGRCSDCLHCCLMASILSNSGWIPLDLWIAYCGEWEDIHLLFLGRF